MRAPSLGIRAGPKVGVNSDPIDLSMLPKKRDWRRVEAFFLQFLRIPKGTNARQPFKLQPFQRTILKGLFPSKGKRPKQGLTAIARGQGKSTLASGVCLYMLFADEEESAQVLNIASDLRQAHIVFDAAVRMIELNPELSSRCKIYQDKIIVPGTNSSMFPLPANEASLQGYDPSAAIVDELAYVTPEVWESVVGASGKRAESLVWAISTPPTTEDSVMHDLVTMAKSNPRPDFSYTEFTSDSSHAVDCLHCWKTANPALGKFLHLSGMQSVQRTMRESSFRRLRLGQFGISAESAYIAPEVWRRTEDATRPLFASDRIVGFFY